MISYICWKNFFLHFFTDLQKNSITKCVYGGGGLFLDTQLPPTLRFFLFLSQSHAPLLTNTADEPSMPHQISVISLLSF